MRTSIIKIVLLGSVLLIPESILASPSRYECLEKIGSTATKQQLDDCVNGNNQVTSRKIQASNSNTSSEEDSCTQMGFKRRTESFGNCVLELASRKDSVAASNDPDSATCIKYGFKPKTSEYASCRLQIDQARQQAQQQQAQYDEQKRQYDLQKAEADRQRRMQASLKLMDMSQRMSSGQNAADAYRGANGLPPLQPPVAPIQTQTYMLPGNKMMTCTSAGSVTNCF